MKETNKVVNGLFIYILISLIYGIISVPLKIDINNTINYLIIGIITFIIMINYFKKTKIENKKIDFKLAFLYGIVAIGLASLGSLLVTILNNILELTGYHFTGENLSVFKFDNLYNGIIMSIYVIIVAPIIEEIIFRGYSLQVMRKYGNKTAIILAAFFFGIFHMEFMQFFSAILAGLFFGVLYVKYESIKMPIIAHMVNNIVAIILTQTNINTTYLDILFATVGIIILIIINKKENLLEFAEKDKNNYKIEYLLKSIPFLLFVFISLLIIISTFKPI